MSVAPAKLAHVVAPNPEAIVFTAAAPTVLRRLNIINPTGGAQTISVSVAGQRVLGGKNVPANDDLVREYGIPLAVGETITAVSSAAGTLVLLATGFTY